MKASMSLVIAALLAVCVMAPDATAQKKHKIKNTVTFAPSWKAAVEKAKLLNVPIIVHDHGFY